MTLPITNTASNQPEKNILHQTENLIPAPVTSDLEIMIATDNDQNQKLAPASLNEASVAHEISTLEALLKAPSDSKWLLGSNSRQLNRLRFIASQVGGRRIESQRAQHNNRKKLAMKQDAQLSHRKGIRILRREKAQSLRKVFCGQNSTHDAIEVASRIEETNSDSKSSTESPAPEELSYKIQFECYICKTNAFTSHHFYDQMCPKCGDFNYAKRLQLQSSSTTELLKDHVALVTGGRIKIGYETALILLRCGAHVIVTTRFPNDAAFRYSKEVDFAEWKHRLDIYGVDFRVLNMVEDFCAYLNTTLSKLDILIQNAAQTIRRPVQFYEHLLKYEQDSHLLPLDLRNLVKRFETMRLPGLPGKTQGALAMNLETEFLTNQNHSHTELSQIKSIEDAQMTDSAAYSQLIVHPDDADSSVNNMNIFPQGVYDDFHQQLDLRSNNSWVLQMDQVETSELVEVQLINSISPFIILNKLTPLMAKRTSSTFGWLIMVSSMEGSFSRPYKTSCHPHTNCAKASLNMIVRTSAAYYKSKYKLLMNAVDTGWVTDEDPVPMQSQRKQKFHPPLDEIDGAMRILDPIFQTLLKGNVIFGCFLKDYECGSW